jgi:hypothetical protein
MDGTLEPETLQELLGQHIGELAGVIGTLKRVGGGGSGLTLTSAREEFFTATDRGGHTFYYPYRRIRHVFSQEGSPLQIDLGG